MAGAYDFLPRPQSHLCTGSTSIPPWPDLQIKEQLLDQLQFRQVGPSCSKISFSYINRLCDDKRHLFAGELHLFLVGSSHGGIYYFIIQRLMLRIMVWKT